MITSDQINKASSRLSNEFRSNVDGPATKLVSEVDPRAKAFGQHLKPGSSQRGLHGTAAAMSVLSHSTSESDLAALIGFAHYCENRQAIEEKLDEAIQVDPRRVRADGNNVIKLSEILYGLSKAPTPAGLQPYAQTVAESLRTGVATAAAWSYQLNGPANAAALLPTAWAVLALHSHGYDVQQQIVYIEEQLDGKGDQPADIAVKVFALYVLLRVSSKDDKRKRRWFQGFWEKLGPLLGQDLEANIEYLHAAHVLYVRVPWQLYLIACAAELSPYRAFARPRTQARLTAIINQVDARGGLVYPHSGDMTSSRTNAILYETLDSIQTALKVKHLPLGPFFMWNWIVGCANSAIARRFAQVFAGTLVLFTLWQWSRSNTFNWEQTAPNFAASVLLFLLAGRRSD